MWIEIFLYLTEGMMVTNGFPTIGATVMFGALGAL